MLNLSKLARESPNYSIFRRIKNINMPEIYLAENIKDYQVSIEEIRQTHYLRSSFFNRSPESFYTIFQNVGITGKDLENENGPNWFLAHDDTSKELFYWSKDLLFPSIQSFEEAQESQGLLEDDFVQELFVRTLIDYNLGHIVDVSKYKNHTRRKNPVLEGLEWLIPRVVFGLSSKNPYTS